jgi:hypothetical protein
MADPRAALARVVEVHDVAPPAEGPDRQAAADDLAEGREVGPDAQALLRAAPRRAERDDLVEDQHDPVTLGDLAQPGQESLRRGQQAGIAHHRVHDEAGELRGFLLEDLGARLGVVPGQHHDVLEDRRGQA